METVVIQVWTQNRQPVGEVLLQNDKLFIVKYKRCTILINYIGFFFTCQKIQQPSQVQIPMWKHMSKLNEEGFSEVVRQILQTPDTLLLVL